VGTNVVDNVDKSAETDAWRFEGMSGNDIFKGGSGNDTFWGGLGNDSLTGNGGSDTYYYADFTEGTDIIAGFSTADNIRFNAPLTGAYARSNFAIDNGSGGSVYNIATSSTLPKVFNFTVNNGGYQASSTTANFLSNFRVTTDGSTSTTSATQSALITGNGTHSAVYHWNDNASYGTVQSSELSLLAEFISFNNDTFTTANVTFGGI